MHTHMHTHIHAHTCTHTCTHTYTNTGAAPAAWAAASSFPEYRACFLFESLLTFQMCRCHPIPVRITALARVTRMAYSPRLWLMAIGW